MSKLNLIKVAKELLEIKEDLHFRVKSSDSTESEFTLYDFEESFTEKELGLNTSKDSSFTARIYALVPIDAEKEDCLIYLAGAFWYSVPSSKALLNDIINSHIEPKGKINKYLQAAKRCKK